MSRTSVLPTSSLLSLAQSGMVLHQIPTSSLLSLAQSGIVCTRFKLWKWNCSAIWPNLSSFHSNLHKIVVQSYCSIRWCPGHPCFLHQVFFLWHNPAWLCTRFKLWKWNCSAIWHNLSSFHSNLHKIVVQSNCLCTKSERLHLARENTVSWDIHTEKYPGQWYFLSLLFSE